MSDAAVLGDDAALFADWSKGDQSAGQKLVTRHIDRVTRFFMTKAAGEVEELTQRTFLRLLEVKDRYANTGTFRAFTLGVARMVLLEFYRSRARDARVDFGVSSIARLTTTPSVKIAKKDERAMVVAAMQQLSVDHQIVLELHYWEGLSVAEVAQATEVSPGTVKSRLHRARAALEAALGGRFPMESTRR